VRRDDAPLCVGQIVWYRVTVWLCFCRVVGVHMANASWFKKPLGNTVGANDSTIFENCR